MDSIDSSTNETIGFENSPKKPVNETRNVPRHEIELGNLALKVSNAWNANPWLVLQWTTAAEFATQAALFNELLYDKKSIKGKRPQTTLALKSLDKTINQDIIYVKSYLVEKYGKHAAKSYYAEFGIQQQLRSYILPRNQNSRLAALKLMVAALNAHDFTANQYGTAHWSTIKNEYENALALASKTDSSIAVNVGTKNQVKKKVIVTLNCLLLNIRSNFPDTYRSIFREWGFQKEKY
jgi:hypothetical protein